MSVDISPELRELIIARANHQCEYCHLPQSFSLHKHEIDHIIPLQHDGETNENNLALACLPCNSHKYDHIVASDPIDGKLVPLYNPRLQKWEECFGWSDDFSQVVGLTPSGRATVEALKLNRPGVINMRRLLVLVGQHPQKSK